MKMIFKLLLSANLALCLLSSSSMAMEELKKGAISSRPRTAQSVRGKSESRPATATRGVKRFLTFKEAAEVARDAKAAALATKKARLTQLAAAAKKAITKPSQTGAGVLTAQPRLARIKQTPLALVVAKKNSKRDQERSSNVVQASSSSRALSLGVTPASSQQQASLTSLSDPLIRMILRFLGPQDPQDPQDICRIARTSLTINRVIDEDHFFWGQIYHQNFPHALFNAMQPADKKREVAQFKQVLPHLHGPIDPENPGRGYGKAFKFYSKSSSFALALFARLASSCELSHSHYCSVLPALAILLRNSTMVLYFFKSWPWHGSWYWTDYGISPDNHGVSPDILLKKNNDDLNYVVTSGPEADLRQLKTEVILDTRCFNDKVYETAIIAFSLPQRNGTWFIGWGRERILDKYVNKGILRARFIRAISHTGDLTWDCGYRERNLDFAREEMNALCNLNYFLARQYRLNCLVYADGMYKKNRSAAAQEYERCSEIFNDDLEKLESLKETYTRDFSMRRFFF